MITTYDGVLGILDKMNGSRRQFCSMEIDANFVHREDLAPRRFFRLDDAPCFESHYVFDDSECDESRICYEDACEFAHNLASSDLLGISIPQLSTSLQLSS